MTLEVEFNAEKKCHVLEMGNNAMRSLWTYLLENIKRRDRFGSNNTGQLITSN